MERIIEFSPAFDKRNSDPDRNYGIGSVELYMTVKGDLGAVTFHMFTNWHLPHVSEEHLKSSFLDPITIKVLYMPGPSEIVYHSPTPIHKDHEPSQDVCPYLDGKRCYRDIGYSISDGVFDALLKEGHDGVWRELERLYNDQFVETEKAEAIDA